MDGGGGHPEVEEADRDRKLFTVCLHIPWNGIQSIAKVVWTINNGEKKNNKETWFPFFIFVILI